MEEFLGMEEEQVDTARSRAGSCVEFYSLKVSFFFLNVGYNCEGKI